MMFPHNFFLDKSIRSTSTDLCIVFNTILDLIEGNKWDLVKDVFKTLCENDYVEQVKEEYDRSILLGFLAITSTSKHKIGHWREVAYERIYEALKSEVPDTADGLVKGLK